METDDQLINAVPDPLNALKEAFAALGKDPRWSVSTLRLDIIRPAIVKADPSAYQALYTRPRKDSPR